MTQEQNETTQGTLMRGADGAFYLITDEQLQACRLTGELATQAQQLIDSVGDVQGYGLTQPLLTPFLTVPVGIAPTLPGAQTQGLTLCKRVNKIE